AIPMQGDHAVMNVKPVDASNTDEAIRILADAFQDDPVINWSCNSPPSLEPFFQFTMPVFIQHQLTYLDQEGRGAASWLGPGQTLKWPVTLSSVVKVLKLGGLKGVYRMLLSGMQTERHHPKTPHYYLFAIGVTAVFLFTVAFGIFAMKFILFPSGGIETFVIKIETSTGTSVGLMSEKLSAIEKIVATLPESELDCFTARAGIIQEHPGDPDTKRGSNYGVILVYLTPEEKRTREANEIMEFVRKKTAGLPGFTKIEFKPIRYGPHTGPPIYITIKGDDYGTLREIAGVYKEHLKKIPGLKDIKDNYEPGKDELRIFVDDKKAALTGISVFDIATTVRACYAGNVSTSIKKAEEKIDIRVIFPPEQREKIDSWKSIKIINRMGNLIPLAMVAQVERKQGISVIYRKGWRRNINVSAEIDEKAKDVTSVSVNSMLMKRFASIGEKYPGYTVDYEGEFKDTQESIQNLMRSFLIAAVAIYIILIAVFRSLAQPVIIMAIIPLSLIAVIWSFFLHGLPISFLALMGVVGLAGVVVNNSIVFLDFVNTGRCNGLSPMEASMEAGAKRMRPIVLSSLTTVMGLAPTAYGILGNEPFLKPMALSMVWGLALGTIITLFITPVLYIIFTDLSAKLFKRDMICGKNDVPYHDDEENGTMRTRMEADLTAEFADRLKREITEEMVARFRAADPGGGRPPRGGKKKR
ncbi:MAG: efflux RND transporter permease subunit, partial [Chrysiogenales bacterium]